MQGNHYGGEGVSTVVEARLRHGPRATGDARRADVFFIPWRTRDMCVTLSAVQPFKRCGVDFSQGRDVPAMWRWLLQQPAFQESDGGDHFLILDPPRLIVRRPQLALPTSILLLH